MCKRCSLYVQYDLADQLVRTLKRTSLGPSRSRSATNLSGSLPLEPELNIRCCQDCYKLLIKRKERMDQQENQPLLVLLYEKLQNAVESASKIAPEYQHIADSLNQGEEGYDLGKANEMRFKLMKLYETVDVLSKKIAALDTNDEENPPPAVALRLQASIRSASHAYLQENMLTLPSLPSLPKLEILQKKRRQQQEEKLRKQMEEAEKERAEAQRFHELERLRREREDTEKKSSSLTNNAQNVNQVVLHDGWSAVTSKKETNIKTNDEENDPILEQIAYVREMISQAQAAGRAEEVQSLNKNLEELKNEHRRQVVAAFSSTATASRSSFSDRDQLNNPFYDDSDRSTLVTNSNPFVQESSSTDKGNPFLTSDDNSDNNNPFVEKDQPPVRTESDPLLLQIRYISQCLDKAIKSGKRDEVAILRENLRELKAVYNNQ